MAQTGGAELTQKMQKFLPSASNAHVAPAKIEFTDMNWTPILILWFSTLFCISLEGIIN